jgi:hypothetical protein
VVDRFEHLDCLAGNGNDRRVRLRRSASVMIARSRAWGHLHGAPDLVFEADCARDLSCHEGRRIDERPH